MNNMRQPILKKLAGPCRPLMPLVLLGVLCLFALCGCDQVRNRKAVATVNGEKIYLEEYQQRLNAQKGLLSPKAFPDAFKKREMLEDEILDSMITEKIILQRAREMNLSISDTELEKKLMDIRKDYGDNFFDLLRAQNVRYDDWREELRKEMLFDRLVAADVNATIRVSEDEAKDYFNAHPDLCKPETRIRAAQIVVRDPAKAALIKARLEKGEDFAKVASQTSIGPEAVRGGDLGLISRETMPEPFDKTLFQLRPGKISRIVKSAYGYHIFKVTDIRKARARSFVDCRETVMAGIRAQKEDAAFTVWLAGLKAKAMVKKEIHVLKKKS